MKKDDELGKEISPLEKAAAGIIGAGINFVEATFPKKEAIAFHIKIRLYLLWRIKELRTKKQETSCYSKK